MRVLVVEDEQYLAEAIQTALRRQGIAADLAFDGAEALAQVEINAYDVVVLDRDLPVVHGDQVTGKLVEHHPEVRILMLTAAGRTSDKLTGFGLGADDYLTKPFHIDELVVRLRALARRPTAHHPPVLTFADLRLDPYRREAFRSEHVLRLTRKQFAVLELLMVAQGGLVSAETMLEKAWDENADPFTTAPRVTVSGLRRHLGDPPLIHTVPGEGYRLVDPRDGS